MGDEVFLEYESGSEFEYDSCGSRGGSGGNRGGSGGGGSGGRGGRGGGSGGSGDGGGGSASPSVDSASSSVLLDIRICGGIGETTLLELIPSFERPIIIII